MSRNSYTDDELQLLRILKMQEQRLHELKNDSDSNADKLDSLEKEATELADRLGVDISPALNNQIPVPRVELSEDDIPEWEELVLRSKEEVDYQPFIEDFLSQEEIDYSLEEIERIKKEFKKRTKLNHTDLSFLVIATALQTLRWIIINKIMGDLGEPIDTNTRESSDSGDRRKKEQTNEFNEKQGDRENKKSEKGYPTWKDIIFGQYERTDGRGKSHFSCPYDAQTDGPAGFEDGGRGAHRVNTLGHDPILGWIFGTANIMTCTISLSKKFHFNTYRVLYPNARFGPLTSWPTMFKEVYESIREDKFRLPAAVFAQGAHLASDRYTNRGLPVPLLEVFSTDFAGDLYNEYYDSLCLLRDIKTIGTQAVISLVINMLVSLIHGLFYNPQKDGERKMYEVRTRKVLLYSNSLASAGNIAYAAASQDWGKLDVGGIIVTITRLFSDIRFITRMKHEFIQKEQDRLLEKELSEIDKYFK